MTGILRKCATLWLVSAAFAAAPAVAQSSVSPIDADIVEPLTLVNTRGLDFGWLAAGATAGSAIISTAGARSTTGGVVAAGGTPTSAEFAGYGRRNQQVRISFASNTITLTRTTGPQTMTATAFAVGATAANGLVQIGAPSQNRYRISALTGLFSFTVGATLNVAAAQQAGVYNGTFSVTADYQ